MLSVAKSQGVFERWLEPLGVVVKWSKFELGPPMMEAISTGAIDFGWLGDVPAIIAQSAGAKFVYIKGKKVAFARGTSAQTVILRLLAKAALTYGDIVPVYLLPADASAAQRQFRLRGQSRLRRKTSQSPRHGPVTPAIIAQLQETADAFFKVGVIAKPVVIHNAVWFTWRAFNFAGIRKLGAYIYSSSVKHPG